MNLRITLPTKLHGFFETPARYRILYGGRGSSKSWSVAQMLIVKAIEKKRRILCCREFQNAIKDSSHRLLAETISMLGLDSMFDVLESEIRCKTTGSDFIFKGLRKSPAEIKSTEGIDIAWIEEAEKTSKRSWNVLTPTVRKDGSEIWATYNPEDEEAHIHQLFVLNTPPANSKVIQLNWNDNPWFNETLEAERTDCLTRDPEEYEHIWNGQCKKALEGTYYANILADMREKGQITSVPHEPSARVMTYWDIGFSDDTSIWFLQRVGFQWRLIDFYTASGEDLPHYAQLINSKPYTYSEHVLPHDAKQRRIGMTETVAMQLEGLINHGEVITQTVTQDVERDIQATRAFLKLCYFDETKCEDGLKALRKYRRKWNEDRQKFDDKPLHDWASNPADAFRYLAIANADDKTMATESTREHPQLFPQQEQESYGTINDYF